MPRRGLRRSGGILVPVRSCRLGGVLAVASVVVSACGFIPGTSEAGRANIEEFNPPSSVPFDILPGAAPSTTRPLSDEDTAIFGFATTSSVPAGPTQSTTTEPRWIADELNRARCLSIMAFLEAGSEMERSMIERRDIDVVVANIDRLKAALAAMRPHLPTDAASAINILEVGFPDDVGENVTTAVVFSRFKKFVVANASEVNAMFRALFPICPDMMGSAPPQIKVPEK
jgi:hypothetical protein